MQTPSMGIWISIAHAVWLELKAKRKMFLSFFDFYFNILLAVAGNGKIIEGVKISFNSPLSDATST